MRFLIPIILSTISFASYASSAPDFEHDKYRNFRCILSADFGEMDAALKKMFSPPTKSEKYFLEADHFDLHVTSQFDEARHSYTVEATGANGFHIKSTIPFYPDAELRFYYEFSDSGGQSVAAAEFAVQCKK